MVYAWHKFAASVASLFVACFASILRCILVAMHFKAVFK